MTDGNDGVARYRRIGAGLSIVLFPLMLLAGFATHPNLASFAMVADVESWAAEWRGNFWFHFGHLLVLLAVPLIIVAAVRLMAVPTGRGAWLGLWGGALAIFGAFMLAVDKGALTLVLTAFQGLPDEEFAAITPALEALFNRDGWLWITWGYVTLPLGFVLIVAGLMRESVVGRWQGGAAIAGLVLLINPDIEIISTAGALLMCLGIIPLGLRELRGAL